MPKIENWKYAYCLFCRTGTEDQLARYINEKFSDIQAIATYKYKHKAYKGTAFLEQAPFLPGYIFLYAKDNVSKSEINRISNTYKILEYDEEKTLELRGSDLAFAQWIWDNDGIIGVSRLRTVKDDVMILSGPMLNFSSNIMRIDKHTKNALIEMVFCDRLTEMWLAFEFEDESNRQD